MQVPKRKPGKFSNVPVDDFLTPEAIAALEEELDRLQNRIRPKVVEDLRKAREMGDLSENFAYSDAKGRLGGIDGRIFSIKERLKFAVVIEKGAGAGGQVRIGATVTLDQGGKKKTYEITGAQESDPGKGKISYHSPLGSALMGRKAGETVTVQAGDREIACTIVEVS
jgi:transcription elongation factor GreA